MSSQPGRRRLKTSFKRPSAEPEVVMGTGDDGEEVQIPRLQAFPGSEDAPPAELPPADIPELPASIGSAVDRVGWPGLRRVQKYALPYLLEGRDIMIQSRTGSGKTASFVLPLLERLDPKLKKTQALILLPTRELALQVVTEAKRLAGEGKDALRITPIYGGTAYGPQLTALKEGAHLVVGTPGRILDHLMRGAMKLDALDTLIFDEADHMLSMGFLPDMVKLKPYLPEKRVTGMFSATFPSSVLRLARQFLEGPGFLNLSSGAVHVSSVAHRFCTCPPMDKDRVLIRLIELENPEQAMIFCNTKVKVRYITTVLQRFGYNADALTSELTQKAREKVLAKVRNKEVRFLIATDVAARGIDIPLLSHVFLYEPPKDVEWYIHRAGRTGRAGASGIAFNVVDPIELAQLRRIGRRYDIELEEIPMPTEKDTAAIVGERAVALLEAKRRQRDNLQSERMERFLPLVEQLAADEDERELLAMLLDDFYQQEVHGGRRGRRPEQRAEPEEEFDAEERGDETPKAKKTARKGAGRKSSRRTMAADQDVASEDAPDEKKPAARKRPSAKRRGSSDDKDTSKAKSKASGKAKASRPAKSAKKKTADEPKKDDGLPPARRKVRFLKKR